MEAISAPHAILLLLVLLLYFIPAGIALARKRNEATLLLG